MQLPPYNRYVLQHLMSFLQLVVEHEPSTPARSLARSLPRSNSVDKSVCALCAANKMGPSNLAIVFGPTLLGAGSAESIFTDFTANQKVIEAMIRNYSTLFQVHSMRTPHMWAVCLPRAGSVGY
jgi:hypothetical protein